MTPAGTLALLHTSPAHVPVFDALRDRHHPGLVLRHLVDEELLVRAREAGPGAVAGSVAAVLAGAVADGADAVLCTCSTLGAVAEDAAASLGVPVLRVDRPMAAEAARARRIVVVAALRSTLEPTVALLAEESLPTEEALSPEESRWQPSPVTTVVVEGAWERFEAGDREGYLDAVAEAVDRVPVTAGGVVVLAQASMADAAGRTSTPMPVLSSPRPGLAAAAKAAGAGAAGRGRPEGPVRRAPGAPSRHPGKRRSDRPDERRGL
ncbi:aspartate/glutamate racemase family protein [Streptomyces sp. NPDC012438]|uniref:aspartate/glutamate racemase family protein n=1 Tax=Streptomyces sp. NPDC012438 TaxID=3364833 RepID=UPI0036ED07F4